MRYTTLFLLLPELLLLTDGRRRSTDEWAVEEEESLQPLRSLTTRGGNPSTSRGRKSRRPAVVDSEDIPSSSLFPFSSAVVKTTLEQQQNGPFAIDPTCNSSELREIIVQGISDTPSDSKHRINAAITRNMDGSFGIVCAECSFSYLAHTIQYCHHTRNNITCFVYRDG